MYFIVNFIFIFKKLKMIENNRKYLSIKVFIYYKNLVKNEWRSLINNLNLGAITERL